MHLNTLDMQEVFNPIPLILTLLRTGNVSSEETLPLPMLDMEALTLPKETKFNLLKGFTMQGLLQLASKLSQDSADTSLEYTQLTTAEQELWMLITQSFSLDMEMTMELLTGTSKTHGELLGVLQDISRW